jgi:cytochrome P450
VQSLICQGAQDTPLNLSLAFRCAALEIIMSYCLNYSPSAITYAGFRYPLISLERAIPFNWVMKYIPAFRFLMDPPRILARLLPRSIRTISEFRRQIALHLDEILASPDRLYDGNERETIYHFLIAHDVESRHKPLSREELYHETLTLLMAGSDTVGNTCTVGFFHVLNNPKIHRQLVHELHHAWPDPDANMSASALEKLPYLVRYFLSLNEHTHESNYFYSRPP